MCINFHYQLSVDEVKAVIHGISRKLYDQGLLKDCNILLLLKVFYGIAHPLDLYEISCICPK